MVNTNCTTCRGTGLYVPSNLKTCPKCYPDEQETIFDRDLRAIVAGWISDPAVVVTDTNSVKRIIAICVSIALEMEISRNKRKGLKHE